MAGRTASPPGGATGKGAVPGIAGSLMQRLRARGLGILALAVTLFAVACAPVYQNHGYVPDDEDLAAIQVGVDTRDSVSAAVGKPSTQGLLNDVGWFYVQSRWKHVGGREPEEIDRQVVAITFDEAGIVANIERWGLENGIIVPISRRITESNVKGASFLRQLFGNIGRFSADQFVDG